MITIRDLYKIGPGPSSSHTIGPRNACLHFMNNHEIKNIVVDLYGSLAFTGKGHLTDYIIMKTFEGYNPTINFHYLNEDLAHPNTMKISNGITQVTYYSVGGGSIVINGEKPKSFDNLYLEKDFLEIKNYLKENDIDLYEYVMQHEDSDFYSFLENIFDVMINSVKSGLEKEGTLPGTLKLRRRANSYYKKAHEVSDCCQKQSLFLAAYAYSVSEENAAGELVVTAPTCGATGVVPACLYYLYNNLNASKDELVKSLAVAGIIGNIIKTNASISGAEAGCQAEIGSATAMAAALLSYYYKFDILQIENSIEMALEHSLGLTCDPINGQVQIPCIERNAVFAKRAFAVVDLAMVPNDHQKISFDMVVDTLLRTGKDLSKDYRETSLGGLANFYKKNEQED